MAQETYRANLHSNDFPFFSRDFGETIIVPRYDHTYARQLAPNQDHTKDVGIPQAYYMHNVLPTENGFQSIHYRKVATAQGNNPFGGSDTAPIYGLATPTLEYLHSGYATGGGVDGARIYRFLPNFTDSISNYQATAVDFIDGHAPINVAHVKGLNYFSDKVTAGVIKEIIPGNPVISDRATGVAVAFAGLCAAQGYLIAWKDNNVYWGSLTTPYDFVPSQITGAGGGSVSGIKGTIIRCVPTLNGFVIFGKRDAVFASYTGNTRYPFSFTDIKNAGGIANGFSATDDGDSGTTYALSSAGLQGIISNQSETIVPGLDAYVHGLSFEEYIIATNLFEYTALKTYTTTNNLYMKIAYVAKRYLCISYGRNEVQHYSAPPPVLLDYYNVYEYVLVFDTVLMRWGKLKKQHVSVFTYTGNVSGSALGTDSIGLVGPDGEVWVVDTDLARAADTDSVLILGKYQHLRGRFLHLHEVNIQFEGIGDTFNIGSYYTLDGRTKAGFMPGYESYVKEGIRNYSFDLNAYNHSIVCTGDFNLNTLILTYSDGGNA